MMRGKRRTYRSWKHRVNIPLPHGPYNKIYITYYYIVMLLYCYVIILLYCYINNIIKYITFICNEINIVDAGYHI